MRGGALATLCAFLIATGASFSPAQAYPRPGRTERVSVASDGSQADAPKASFVSSLPAISADGRYAAFNSAASNLVADDTNDTDDIFVHDRDTGVTERVSVSSDGIEGNNRSLHSAISADGRYVAFVSGASNLVPDDTNKGPSVWDLFVHDRGTGVTERVSVSSDGAEGNGSSVQPSISADGRYVAFASGASNLVPGDSNELADVFVHDRQSGTTERVSVASDGGEALGGPSPFGSISADGRFVAFDSFASNLAPGDTNGNWDVFVHDRDTGVTERVSVGTDGAQGNDSSLRPSISADGRYVAFDSGAVNLISGDTNGVFDIFVRDRQTSIIERISVDRAGAEGAAHSIRASISADGRHVAFDTAAQLAPDDDVSRFAGADAYVHDRATGSTELVSVSHAGGGGDRASISATISANARYVAFSSLANNLVPGDDNEISDAFVRDRGSTIGVGRLSAATQGDQLSVSGWATFSGQDVSSATDAPDDGEPGAEQVGAEMTATSVTYRPEPEDLLFRLKLFSFPRRVPAICAEAFCVGATAGAGAPGVVYGFELTVAGAVYEIRAQRAAASASDPISPHFALYRCDPDCVGETVLSGGIGTTGNEVRVALPLEAVGAETGSTFAGLRAYTALGHAATGELAALDELDLTDASLSGPNVVLGISSPGTPEDEVHFDREAELAEGHFSALVDVSSLSPGDYEVWAKACLGEQCGAVSTPVMLEGEVQRKETILDLTVDGRGDNMTLQARLAEAESSEAIAGRTIDFYSDGEPITSEKTDSNGMATVLVPPAHRGANRTYEARFEGDDFYLASSDERSGRTGGGGAGGPATRLTPQFHAPALRKSFPL